MCAQDISCANYISTNEQLPTSTILSLGSFSVVNGFNRLNFTTRSVKKGSIFVITVAGAQLALDTSGTAKYSDYYFPTPNLYKLNQTSNWAVYLKVNVKRISTRIVWTFQKRILCLAEIPC